MELCGADVGCIVIDSGSALTRIGYAGEVEPCTCVPTHVGSLPLLEENPSKRTWPRSKPATQPKAKRAKIEELKSMEIDESGTIPKKYIFDSSIRSAREGMEIISPFKDGEIQDWEAITSLWENCIRGRMSENPEERPLLFSEPSQNSQSTRRKMCEAVFESLGARLMYSMRDATLACFGVGKTTGLVVDMGASATKCIPVNDGYILQRPIRRTKCAGAFIDQSLGEHLLTVTSKKQLTPGVILRNPKTPVTSSFTEFMENELLRDIKETLCYIRPDDPTCGDAMEASHEKTYELPDGTVITLTKERYDIPEVLFKRFHPSLSDEKPFKFEGLHYMIQGTILDCDADIRRELYANLVVTGGCSKIKGLRKRLAAMIVTIAPPAFSPKIISTPQVVKSNQTTSFDYSLGVWTGGSVLGSLGHFQQHWLSREDYDDVGPSLLTRTA